MARYNGSRAGARFCPHGLNSRTCRFTWFVHRTGAVLSGVQDTVAKEPDPRLVPLRRRPELELGAARFIARAPRLTREAQASVMSTGTQFPRLRSMVSDTSLSGTKARVFHAP